MQSLFIYQLQLVMLICYKILYCVHRFSLFLLCIIYIYIRTYLGVRYWIDYQTYRHMLSN
jgi:hypothetical protein